MNNIYVMSDLHGELEMFEKMLEKIKFDKNDRLIILGDILDRGDKPITLLRKIIETPNIEMIMGNHERMFLDYITSNEKFRILNRQLYMKNGGYTTLKEYNSLDELSKIQVIEYLNNLPLYKIIDNYILVHSGVNMLGMSDSLDIEENMSMQIEEDLLWSREGFYNCKAINNHTVIFGHTPTINLGENDSFNIWYDEKYKDKIGIDCGATFVNHGGKLCCLNLNNNKVVYVTLTEKN